MGFLRKSTMNHNAQESRKKAIKWFNWMKEKHPKELEIIMDNDEELRAFRHVILTGRMMEKTRELAREYGW